MKPNRSQQKGDIFEMILSSGGSVQSTPIKAKAHEPHQPKIEDWPSQKKEGQLAVDVYETDKNVIVITTMAGAQTDKIEVYVHNHDLLTIRGIRNRVVEENKNTHAVHQECFWGKFSRTLVLPSDVIGSQSSAEYRNGLLKITIPKQKSSHIPIEIVEE